MNNLERRIERLEEELGMKPEPRIRLITNVLAWEGFAGCIQQLSNGLYVYPMRGGPVTDEEIRELNEKYERGDKGEPTRTAVRTA